MLALHAEVLKLLSFSLCGTFSITPVAKCIFENLPVGTSVGELGEINGAESPEGTSLAEVPGASCARWTTDASHSEEGV